MKLVLKRRVHWCNQEIQQFLDFWTGQTVLKVPQEDCQKYYMS